MSEKMKEKPDPRPPRKRFALTIIGEADYHETSTGAKIDFLSFYNQYKQLIEEELNKTEGIRVGSSLNNFRLYPGIGQVQES